MNEGEADFDKGVLDVVGVRGPSFVKQKQPAAR